MYPCNNDETETINWVGEIIIAVINFSQSEITMLQVSSIFVIQS